MAACRRGGRSPWAERLARLRLDAGVGDTISLTLLIPTARDFGYTGPKSFTLVGILADKLIYLDRWERRPAYRDYPAGCLRRRSRSRRAAGRL